MATTTAARLVLPTGQEWPLTGDVLTIGRAVGNNIQIDEQHVSAEHAKIMRLGSDYLLLDLRSSNGTYVNGQRVEDLRRLRDGDVVEVATRQFRFQAPPVKGRGKAAPPQPEPTPGMIDLGLLLLNERPLVDRELSIGRAPSNHLILDDSRVSAEHAKIVRLGEDYVLLDLRSSNGTYVNEQRVEDLHRLQPGDVIAIGAAKLTFVRRLVRLEDEMPLHTLTASFVFADTTGRRWLAVRILAALLVLALLTSIILFFLLVLR